MALDPTNYYVLDPSNNPADKAEWNYAWRIAVPGVDKAELNNNEVWQYMSSSKNDTGDWEHTFRHRCHPRTNDRLYRHVAATGGFVFRLTEG